MKEIVDSGCGKNHEEMRRQEVSFEQTVVHCEQIALVY